MSIWYNSFITTRNCSATLNRRSVYVFDAQKASEYYRENNIKSHKTQFGLAHNIKTISYNKSKTILSRYVDTSSQTHIKFNEHKLLKLTFAHLFWAYPSSQHLIGIKTSDFEPSISRDLLPARQPIQSEIMSSNGKRTLRGIGTGSNSKSSSTNRTALNINGGGSSCGNGSDTNDMQNDDDKKNSSSNRRRKESLNNSLKSASSSKMAADESKR